MGLLLIVVFRLSRWSPSTKMVKNERNCQVHVMPELTHMYCNLNSRINLVVY